jgi:hypothetical protein
MKDEDNRVGGVEGGLTRDQDTAIRRVGGTG